jgi:vancomycin resistance protein YoaR
LDATVFYPTADLKFKNNTGHHLLLQSTVDKKMQKLTFEIYGTSDNRKATISTPKMWDQSPPPPDLYQDDPTLPAGQVKQIDWSAWGAKASFVWKVTRNNEVLQEKTFTSNYRPWQAVYLRGTQN